MAQAEHLPIYKASYDLCVYLEDVVRRFSRYHKYGLGTGLRAGAATSAAHQRRPVVRRGASLRAASSW